MANSTVKLDENITKWTLDFSSKTKAEKSAELSSPPGYFPSIGNNQIETIREADSARLIIKKSWDLALGPIKQVPMNMFLVYMAGNSISIFPIMMIGMIIIRSVKALFTIQQAFKMIEGKHAASQKIVYFIGNIVNVGVALYKCQSLGLLPTHASDWLAFAEPQIRVEYSGGGLSYL
ncbi:hypothetical protein PGB90_007716 [Kerria lacca]